MRLFIAVFPPKDVQDEVFGRLAGESLLKKIKWGQAKFAHITLKFLGQIKNDSIFRDVLTRCSARHRAFDLHLKGGGGFPTLRRPRVLWTGLAGSVNSLASLASDVEQECAALGFPPENRRFSPHLTLARVEGMEPESRDAFLTTMEPYRSSPFPVNEIHLVESRTAPAGSIYSILFSSPLSL